MSIKLNLITLSLTLGACAYAEPSPSEFFFQAPAHKSVATIQAGYLDREYKVKGVGNASDSGLSNAGLRYERGINDTMSVEGVVSYSLRTLKYTGAENGQVNGLDNVQVNFKGTYPGMGWRWRYGAYNSIGVLPASRSITTGGSPNFHYNASSGSFTFTPYTGFDFDVGSGIFGAKVSYDLVKNDTVIHSSGAPVGYGGGQDLIASVFYELSMEPSLIGLSLSYINESGSYLGTASQSGFATYAANIYARFGYTDNWQIVPSFTYMKNATDSNVDMYAANYIDSENSWRADLKLRYTY